MRKAITHPFWLGNVLVAVGFILFSQSLSFGWYKAGSVEFSSHVQSICLCLIGIAFVGGGFVVRALLVRLTLLETELKRLQAAAAGA